MRIAERFKSVQGEGVYAGTPMAFIRTVGCSVGKRICQHCDTDFDQEYPWLGGGEYYVGELVEWAVPYKHVCITGGEPCDQPGLEELCTVLDEHGVQVHIETSGTVVIPDFLKCFNKPWVTICPKPGWIPEQVFRANEIKVIVGGLGTRSGWPGLDEALHWAALGKIVFLQPRNKKHDVDMQQLALAEELVRQFPQLRLSVQMHKLLRVR